MLEEDRRSRCRQRIDEGLQHGREYVALIAREQLNTSHNTIWIGMAELLAAKGEYDEAIAILQRTIDDSERVGRAGLALARAHHTCHPATGLLGLGGAGVHFSVFGRPFGVERL